MVFKSSIHVPGSGTGSVTEIDTGTGLTGGPITTTGTISIATNTANSLAGFDNSGIFSDVTVGSGLTLSGGSLSVTGGGSGTVTSVSVATANGFSGTVANATTTPAITIIAGAIAPTSVNGVVLSGSSTPTLAVTGTTTVSGSNTGDQTTSGTSNRISVSNGSTNPIIDISSSYVGQASITTLGTVGTGVWQGTVIGPTYGGTGINNGSSTFTIGGNTTFSGAHTFTGTLTADTSVTFPTSGTLSTTTGTVTTTGSPASGNLTKFSGTSSITNGDLSGDITTSGTLVSTLATVNSNVGTFGSSTSIPTLTVNAKGLVTAASGNAVIAPAGTLSGTTLASNVITSSLTTVGTIGTGTWQGSIVGPTYGGTGTNNGSNSLTIGASASVSGANTGDQLTFKTIAVPGQSDVVADTTTDTLNLSAGSGMIITTDASTDTITFSTTGVSTPSFSRIFMLMGC